MALTAGVQRPEVSGKIRSAPQLDNTTVFQGGAVMLDTSGRALAAAAGTSGAFCAGVAVPRDEDLDRYDNTVTGHADGFVTVRFQEGQFGFLNDGSNPILSTTQPGTVIYAKDDQTASLSSSSGTRPVLGRLVKLDSGVVGGPVVVEMSEFIGKQASEEVSQTPGTAFTQTYATADHTVPAATTHAIADSSGGAASTSAIAAITQAGTAGSADITPTKNAIATLAAEAELVKADVLENRKLINGIIDLLQAAGIAG